MLKRTPCLIKAADDGKEHPTYSFNQESRRRTFFKRPADQDGEIDAHS